MAHDKQGKRGTPRELGLVHPKGLIGLLLKLDWFELIEGVTWPRDRDGAPHVLRQTIEPEMGVPPWPNERSTKTKDPLATILKMAQEATRGSRTPVEYLIEGLPKPPD